VGRCLQKGGVLDVPLHTQLRKWRRGKVSKIPRREKRKLIGESITKEGGPYIIDFQGTLGTRKASPLYLRGTLERRPVGGGRGVSKKGKFINGLVGHEKVTGSRRNPKRALSETDPRSVRFGGEGM